MSLSNFLIDPKFSPWSSPADCHPVEHLVSRPRKRYAGTQPRNTRIARAVVSWKTIITRVRKFLFNILTTLFSFLSLFFSLHSRKLIKMMYHSLHSRASKNGREINVEEQMGRTRSTRHSGKKSWRSPNSTPPPTRILRNNHLAAAGAAAAAYLPPSAITHDLIFFSFISD